MSEEMAEKKKRELEEMEQEEKRLFAEMEADACTHCGKLISTFDYLAILPGLMWIECPGCGGIFIQASLRKRKLLKLQGKGDVTLVTTQ